MTQATGHTTHNDQHDLNYMELALMLARRGLGTTMPNPSVGAIIVRRAGTERRADVVVGRGWTQPGGRPHAEVEALRRAGKQAKRATLYVTLEPCSHHGQSPPCVDAVIAAGIARVVVGTGDPDKRVAGRGIERLRDAGIEVVEGVSTKEANRVTAGHILRQTKHRPFVQVKLAVSANDVVSHASDGAPVWVTGPAARDQVHLMRARTDAVLTGIGTVLADDPDLTCRLPGMSDYSPIRIVLDRQLRLPLSSKLVRTAREVPVWVICGTQADPNRVKALAALGIEIVPVASGISVAVSASADTVMRANYLLWRDILGELAYRGVTRLMVEAGPRVATSLDHEDGLVDEYVLFRGAKPIGEDHGTPLGKIWSAKPLRSMKQSAPRRLAGGDKMTIFRR